MSLFRSKDALSLDRMGVEVIGRGEEAKSKGVFRFVYVNLGEVRTVFSAANMLVTALMGIWQTSKAGVDGVMNQF